MKIKSAVKRLCEHCYMVRRGKTLYVRCTKNPRHKQRQGFATLATRGPPEPPRAWLSPLTRGDPAVASVDHAAPVDHAALLERLFAEGYQNNCSLRDGKKDAPDRPRVLHPVMGVWWEQMECVQHQDSSDVCAA